MFNSFWITGCLLFTTVNFVTALSEYPPAPATFEAKDYTQWTHKIKDARRATISVPFKDGEGNDDSVDMIRLDVAGDSYSRGYGHGYLLAKEIVTFGGPKLDKFFMDEVLNIDISAFPEPLQEILRVIQIKGAIAAPAAFHEALGWVWNKEESYVPQYIKDEISGIAAGMCDSPEMKVFPSGCNVTEWTQTLQNLNMLPELIRMACTAYGAWGVATPDETGLIQLRALDFGSGPFANYTVLAVNRETGTDGNAFASVTFPGFVGVITGVSQRGIGVSEKVWMTYDKIDLQPGSYDGEADVFVLRDILELKTSREDAENYIMNVNRTWAIWIGIGDYETQKFDLVGYKQDSAVVYTDETAPAMTGQPYLESIAYVDKHPQPSGEGPNGTLPTALADFHGAITLETSKTIIQYHKSGDLHIATYDFTAKQMYLSIGRINHDGNYGPENGDLSTWKAYNRPYLKFNLDDLWSGN